VIRGSVKSESVVCNGAARAGSEDRADLAVMPAFSSASQSAPRRPQIVDEVSHCYPSHIRIFYPQNRGRMNCHHDPEA
jgi:hypothetical protein